MCSARLCESLLPLALPLAFPLKYMHVMETYVHIVDMGKLEVLAKELGLEFLFFPSPALKSCSTTAERWGWQGCLTSRRPAPAFLAWTHFLSLCLFCQKVILTLPVDFYFVSAASAPAALCCCWSILVSQKLLHSEIPSLRSLLHLSLLPFQKRCLSAQCFHLLATSKYLFT